MLKSSKPCLFSKQSEEVEAKTNNATFFIKQVGQKSTTINENNSNALMNMQA